MKRDRNRKPDDKMDDSWLLPYADMLTLLLALFIVLFAMSEIDIKRFENLAFIFKTEFSSGGGLINDGESIVPEKPPVDIEKKEADEASDKEDKASQEDLDAVRDLAQLQAMQEDIEAYIAANNLTETLGTKLTEEGLFVTVRTDITFDSGSAKVKDHGVEIAKEIATMIDSDPPHEIVVNGHADDRPMHNEEFASNWELSSMRAIQFMYLLLEDSSLEPKWFSAKGYGEHRPIVENTSEENRALNRRVEVLIQPNYDLEETLQQQEENEDHKDD